MLKVQDDDVSKAILAKEGSFSQLLMVPCLVAA